MANETLQCYLFINIDQITQWDLSAFTRSRTAANGRRLLRDLNRVYPIPTIYWVFTDNNKEFTDRLFNL